MLFVVVVDEVVELDCFDMFGIVWKCGDVVVFDCEMYSGMMVDFELCVVLLVNCNCVWVEKIVVWLCVGWCLFVVVGVVYMVGLDGLFVLLVV